MPTHKPLRHERITESIIGAFYAVYNELGYGFLEHIYQRALEQELLARGHRVRREVAIWIYYRGVPIGSQRLDMVIDDCVVVEIKSTQLLHPSAGRQLFSYL